MSKAEEVILWIPRIAGLLLAIFVIYEMINIPINRPGILNSTARFLIDVVFVLVILVIGWYRQWIGAILYFALGIYFADRAWAHGKYWTDYALLAGSTLILSILFFVAWIILIVMNKIKQRRESRE